MKHFQSWRNFSIFIGICLLYEISERMAKSNYFLFLWLSGWRKFDISFFQEKTAKREKLLARTLWYFYHSLLPCLFCYLSSSPLLHSLFSWDCITPLSVSFAISPFHVLFPYISLQNLFSATLSISLSLRLSTPSMSTLSFSLPPSLYN